jgi:Tol biopolymer transport system component
MDADGGHPKQLANDIEDLGAQCSLDGKWVVYAGLTEGKEALWKVPIDGGDPVRMTDVCYTPAVSPDGRWIACIYRSEHRDSHIAIIPFEGGKPINLVNDPQREAGLTIRWMPDSRAISYVQTLGEVSNIWRQPINGGPAKQVTDFKDQQIFSHDWSRDGKQLLCTRGMNVRTTFLITEAK